MIKNLKEKIYSEKESIIFCLGCCLVIGFIAHGFAFTDTNFSHDSLAGIFASKAEKDVKFVLGRFIVPLYQGIFRKGFALPWLIGIISLFFIGLTVFVITKLFDIKSKPVIVLIAGVMTTNIAVISQTATDLFELDCNMFALFCAVLSVYFWSKGKSVIDFCLSVLFMLICMGIYQSYVAVAIALIMMDTIFRLMENEKISKIMLRVGKGVSYIGVSFIAYDFLSRYICKRNGLEIMERADIFVFEEGENIFNAIGKLIGKAYLSFFNLLCNQRVFGVIILVICIIMAVVAGVLLIYLFITRKIKWVNKIFIPVVLVLMPLGMNVVYILARGFIHDLMTFSFFLTFVLFILFVYKIVDKFLPDLNFIKGISLLLVAILIWQNILIANTLYLKKDLEYDSTLSTMTRVIAKMEEFEGYEIGKTPVVMLSPQKPYNSIEAFEEVSLISGADRKIAVSYYETIIGYFTYVMNYPMNFCDYDTHVEMAQYYDVINMPVFPNDGFIQMVDGVMVVKLG